MKITITEADVRWGEKRNPWRCPVALAIKRATNNEDVAVTGGVTRLGNKRTQTPRSVMEFIAAFDDGRELPPLPYEMELEIGE